MVTEQKAIAYPISHALRQIHYYYVAAGVCWTIKHEIPLETPAPPP